ncbi:MAG: asparaginase [Gemmatimonadota bacterium]
MNETRVARGGETESVHRIRAVVAWDGRDRDTWVGEPGLSTFWRSAMKPFQALPLVADGAAASLGFGSEEIALCCASHGGTPRHVEVARGMLDRLGLEETSLACGPHAPYDRTSAEDLRASGRACSRIHNNCSGKHAGMLALATARGWETTGYERPAHPVQGRIRRELRDWIDADPDRLPWAVDGCGVPTPCLPLREMAIAMARLVSRARGGHEAAAAVVGAMTDHPELTSSPGRLPLWIMQAGAGRLLAKEGAEGVLCVAATDTSWGLALKVEDGSVRGVGPAAVETLCALDLLRAEERDALDDVRRVELLNTRGERVGEIRASVGPVERRLAGGP